MTSLLESQPTGRTVAGEAERVVAQLRMGIPPRGHVRSFTVGRDDELQQLQGRLDGGTAGRGLLLHANYGSGKTHLLRLIEDLALTAGYAVSYVEVSAQNGVRFNRMEMVVGAVVRSLRTPDGKQGLRGLFELFDDLTDDTRLSEETREERDELSGYGAWDESGLLLSDALYAALRAWERGDDDTRDFVVDWLEHPERYRNSKRKLRCVLVDELFPLRPPTTPDLSRAFDWTWDNQEPAWAALSSLDQLARLCGLRGFIVLFDEIEDVVYGLNNVTIQQQALRNFCDFFVGRFQGDAYFAATPDFLRRATDSLIQRGAHGFPFRRLSEVDNFQLSPLDFEDFLQLAARVVAMHAKAFIWEPLSCLELSEVAKLLLKEWNPDEPQRMRLAVRSLVSILDDALDEQDG